jgi:hypothetical protein
VEAFCSQVALWLGLRAAPSVFWFEDADFVEARSAWSSYPGARNRSSADPLREPCEYFRWSGSPRCPHVGYTHHDSPLGIMINVCRRGEELLQTAAHECFHIYQDVTYGAGWRKRASPGVEGGANDFVASKTGEIRAFLESWRNARSRPR